MLEATPNDIIRGPVISSSVGRLIACTWPQRCPLPSPRSRNQRPPGQASSFIGMGVSLWPLFEGPISSRSAAKAVAMGALMCTSSAMLSDRLSMPGAIAVMLLSFGGLLGAFLDSAELAAPVAFETAGPFVDRLECLRVRTIKRVAAIAPHLDQANFQEHPEVL